MDIPQHLPSSVLSADTPEVSRSISGESSITLSSTISDTMSGEQNWDALFKVLSSDFDQKMDLTLGVEGGSASQGRDSHSLGAIGSGVSREPAAAASTAVSSDAMSSSMTAMLETFSPATTADMNLNSFQSQPPAAPGPAPQVGMPAAVGLSVPQQSSQGTSGGFSSPTADQGLEAQVVSAASLFLANSASKRLKAVELANMLRDRLGTEGLAAVRLHFGGLLSLLERHPSIFHVHRVPKNDTVALVSQPVLPESPTESPAYASHGGYGAMPQDGTSQPSVSETLSRLRSILTGTTAYDQTQMTPVPSVGAFPMQRTVPSAAPGYQDWGIPAGDMLGFQSPAMGAASMRKRACRCLHIGNVGPQMTEADIRREFSQYGPVESVKLVNQSGRRFGFVNFTSTEAAESVLQALSRHPRWRSNVSFAKRETVVSPVEKPRTLAEMTAPSPFPRGYEPQFGHSLLGGPFHQSVSPFDLSHAKLPAFGGQSPLMSSAAHGLRAPQGSAPDFLQAWDTASPHAFLEQRLPPGTTGYPVVSDSSVQSRF